MKKILLLLFPLVLLQQCTIYHRVKSNNLVTKATLVDARFYEEIPFRLVHGLPAVPVYVGPDSTRYDFLFDTGGYTVLSEALKNKASGVHPKSYIDVKDANNQTGRIHTYMLDQLAVGAVTFRDVGFARIGFTEANFFSCPGIAGTIGPNVMKKCIWYFDYDNHRIIATDQLDRIPGIETATRLPVTTTNIDKPLLEFTIDGQTGRFTFDTGDDGFITLQESFVGSLARDYPSITKLGQTVQAGHGKTREDVALLRIDSIRLGEVLLEDAIVVSRNSPAHSLGAGIFESYNVIFNLGQDEVFFIKRKNASRKPGLRSFGFGVNLNDQQLAVGYVYSNSPASRAGIQVGDELVKVNGEAFRFTDYCDFLNNFELGPLEEIELELVRNGERFQATLKKEKIL